MPVLAFLTGCPQQIPEPEAANYLRLEGWATVAEGAAELEGFLRWTYVSDDPSLVDEPRLFCELWELLELSSAPEDPDCLGCTEVFEGTASVQLDGSTTCESVGWSERDLGLSFGPIELLDDWGEEGREELQAQGFGRMAATRWSPDLGSAGALHPLFSVRPEQWAADNGVAGDPAGQPLQGQYLMSSRFYWDMRDEDLP